MHKFNSHPEHKKFKFMSFKGGKNIALNTLILVVSIAAIASYSKRKGEVQGSKLSQIFAATGSSTMAAYKKYVAPPSAQAPVVVRKSISIFTNPA